MAKDKAWDERCRRCGRCCYEKVIFKGEIYYTPTPCEYLDPQSRQCTVYPDRHRLRPGCAPLTARNLRQGILPADCPYVADISDYPAPHLWETEADESA